MENTGNRIEELRVQKGYSREKLAELAGIGYSTVWRYEMAKEKAALKAPNLQKIAEALGCTVSELLGEGDAKGENTALLDGAHIADEHNVIYVPMISRNFAACAGNGNCYDDLQLEYDGKCRVDSAELAAFYSDKSLVCMRVEGDSMTGARIYDGDTVVCDKSPDWHTGLIYLVYLDGRLMVKAVVSQGEGKPPVLKSANPSYQDIIITEDNTFRVCGRVLEVVPKSFKPEPIF